MDRIVVKATARLTYHAMAGRQWALWLMWINLCIPRAMRRLKKVALRL